MSKKTCTFLQYPRPEGEAHCANHAVPSVLAHDVIQRIHTTYGVLPEKVEEYNRITLDAGGMVLTDQPWIHVRCRGFSVKYKLEHAPFLAVYLNERMEDVDRLRKYGGKMCVTIYMRFSIAVLPFSDCLAVLKSMKKHAARGLLVGQVRKLELAASSQHVHIPGHEPAEA